jgi:hypothetical protein
VADLTLCPVRWHIYSYRINVSSDSSVGTNTEYRAGTGFGFRQGHEFSLFLRSVHKSVVVAQRAAAWRRSRIRGATPPLPQVFRTSAKLNTRRMSTFWRSPSTWIWRRAVWYRLTYVSVDYKLPFSVWEALHNIRQCFSPGCQTSRRQILQNADCPSKSHQNRVIDCIPLRMRSEVNTVDIATNCSIIICCKLYLKTSPFYLQYLGNISSFKIPNSTAFCFLLGTTIFV